MGKPDDPIIKSFVKVVRKSFPTCRIFLFGSRAQGKAKVDSDYDFLLISPQFRKLDWEKRSATVYHLKRNIPAAMDFLCYTPEEFTRKKKQIGIVQEAVKEGIELK